MTTTFTGPVVSENGFTGNLTLADPLQATAVYLPDSTTQTVALTTSGVASLKGLAVWGAALTTAQLAAITTATLPTLTTTQLSGFTTTQVSALNTDLAAIPLLVSALKTIGVTA